MKKLTKIIGLLIIAGIALSACKSTKKANGPDTSGKEVAKDKKENGDSLFAEMQTSPCYGTCPVYKLTIYQSGFTVLEAKKFLDSLGLFHGWMPKERMQEIETYAGEIKFFELDSVYDDKMVTDLPSTNLTLNLGGQKKSVYSRYNVPRELRSLEKLIGDSKKGIKWKVIRLDNNPDKE